MDLAAQSSVTVEMTWITRTAEFPECVVAALRGGGGRNVTKVSSDYEEMKPYLPIYVCLHQVCYK